MWMLIRAAALCGAMGAGRVGGPPEDALRGPTVVESPGAVRFSLGGSARLAERPELIALGEATLSDEDRSAAARELARRDRLLTLFVADEIDAIVRIQLAQSTGATADVLLEAATALGRLHARGIDKSLARDLAGVLSEPGRAAFERSMASVWKRIASERHDGHFSKVTKLDVLATQLKYGAQALAQDFEDAFVRAQRGGELAYAYVFRGLKLSPAQSEKIRDKLMVFYEENGTEPEKEVQDRFFLSVLGYLTEAQREKVLRKFGVVKDGQDHL